jgi:hypothetical protein
MVRYETHLLKILNLNLKRFKSVYLLKKNTVQFVSLNE